MATSVESPGSEQSWQKLLKPYREPVLARSIWQLVNTLVAYFVTWALMIWSLDQPYWLTVVLGAFAGLLTVRLFIINHDCGHQSFFKSRRANDIVGFWTGAMAFTPYLQWRHGHAIHHAKSGQIEDAGIGYFWVMGLEEFQNAAWYERMWYRFYRNPFVLFSVGGLWLFLCEFRLSFRSINWRQRFGVWANNVVWVIVLYGLSEVLGWSAIFDIFAPLTVSAAFWGLSLFYVQHHYDHAYWAPAAEWDYVRAALEGSSYLKMNPVAEWFAGYINYHHIHHLAPKIPNYRLREAHLAIPMFQAVPTLTWATVLKSWRLRLVNEQTHLWSDYSDRRPTDAALARQAAEQEPALSA
jgi:acyl-lipid omega-6 desaturase (Delta-12 desaturase)